MGTVGALLVKRVSRGSRGIQRDFREVHGEMIEQYKGYEIKVYWSNIDLGYVFCVFSMDGEGIMESGTYFYEENAWMGARETVDRYIEVKERGLDRWTI